MHQARMKWLALFIGSSALVSPTAAQDLPPPNASASMTEARSPFAGKRGAAPHAALGDEALAAQRGGAVSNIAEMRGKVSDNSAINVATGNNVVTEGSFGNASGLSTVIQNTGANVLIQSSTIVNVQFK